MEFPWDSSVSCKILRPDNRTVRMTDADAYNLAAYVACQNSLPWFTVHQMANTAKSPDRLVMDTRRPNHWERP